MRVMDPEKDKKTSFVDCFVQDLSNACKTKKLPAKLSFGLEIDSQGSGAGWQTESSSHKWLQLDFGQPTKISEFKISEDPDSSVTRYFIECWDDKTSNWVSCFNGRGIGADFVAPIVGRVTTKARLRVMQTKSGKSKITEFNAYNDMSGGTIFNDSTGAKAVKISGK